MGVLKSHYAWFVVRGSWLDKLTMRESGAVTLTGEIAECNSLQSSLFLMVSFLSLSKGEPRTMVLQPPASNKRLTTIHPTAR